MNKQIKTYEIDQAFSDYCLKFGDYCDGCKYKDLNSCYENFVEDNYIIIERRNDEQSTI